MRYIENRYLEVNAAVKKCRKLLTGFALIIGVLFSMTVYGSTESGTEEKQSDSDILVVYFSRTGEQYNVGEIDKGNTAIIAEMIADETGADIFEILPEEDYYPYTYDELTDVAKQEQKETARPAYAGEVPEFFEENTDELAGKTLIPFSTHEGSGLSGFDRSLASSCPDSTVGEGLAIRGSDAQNDQDNVRSTVNDWISELGF